MAGILLVMSILVVGGVIILLIARPWEDDRPNPQEIK